MAPDIGSEPPPGDLSPRELDVLKILAEGGSTRDIAKELGLSIETVRSDIQRIMAKLGVHSRLEAVARWVGWREGMPSHRLSVENWVSLCEEHACCYAVLVDEGQPSYSEGVWHLAWDGEVRTWRVRDPAGEITTERVVPKGISPPVALFGAVRGKGLSHLAEQIEKIGFPPPGCS